MKGQDRHTRYQLNRTRVCTVRRVNTNFKIIGAHATALIRMPYVRYDNIPTPWMRGGDPDLLVSQVPGYSLPGWHYFFRVSVSEVADRVVVLLGLPSDNEQHE